MNIEQVNVESIEDNLTGESSSKIRLSIDGKIDQLSEIFENTLYIHNTETLNKIMQTPFHTLKKHFTSINFSIEYNWCDWKLWGSLYLKKERHYPYNHKPIIFIIEPFLQLREWNRFYSVDELQNSYKKNATKEKKLFFFEDTEDLREPNFGFVFPINGNISALINVYSDIINRFKKVHTATIKSLNKKIDEGNTKDSIISLFEFPEEIKSSCKQYLMYFGQFLADLGINANTSITEEANRVLFTVVPENGIAALEKIREALNVFLNAPGGDLFNKNDLEKRDLAYLQWEANVFHLKSQLILSQALIETKNATIDTIRISNYQLQEIISKNKLLTDSKNPEESNQEKIMGGIVSIKKFEGKGFSIDFAEILRRLKRRFKTNKIK
jgi:hypothetical protein